MEWPCGGRNTDGLRIICGEGVWWVDCAGPWGVHLGNYLLSNYFLEGQWLENGERHNPVAYGVSLL